MSSRFDNLPHRRAIIDRRALSDRVAALDIADPGTLRRAVTAELKLALDAGRAANGQAFLIDQLIRVLFDAVTQRLYPLSNPTAAERLAILAVGGYGRGEMAPHSDVDIAFLTPWKQTPWAEQVIETMLYALWDL